MAELAYSSNTWSLTGTGADGNPVVLGATTAEVARRQADASWRYVIDNAWGDQAAATASTANASRYPARHQRGGRCGLDGHGDPPTRLGARRTPATLKRLLDLGRADRPVTAGAAASQPGPGGRKRRRKIHSSGHGKNQKPR